MSRRWVTLSLARLPERRFVWLLAAMSCAFLYGCEGSPSALEPQGPGAARVADLWWVILVMGSAIYIGVMAFLVAALFHRSDRPPEDRLGLNFSTVAIVGGGVVLPILVIIPLFALTVRDTVALASPSATPDLTIEVVGHQFWWEVRYPQHDVITANEIHLPAGEPVEFLLTASDVIHSFWFPEIHGKTDLMPGSVNTTWLQVDQPGVYRGICAEYCGMQHAHMQMLIVAQPRDEFEAWLEQQRQPAPEPIDPVLVRGQAVFLGGACAACHAVRGTPAVARVGPDLTHLASRRTLAARMMDNTPENLARWMADPQGIKPGNHMPNMELDDESFHALVQYLLSLE